MKEMNESNEHVSNERVRQKKTARSDALRHA